MSDEPWTETHREALELMIRVGRRDQPEDEVHPFLAETLAAALAEIDRLTADRDDWREVALAFAVKINST